MCQGRAIRQTRGETVTIIIIAFCNNNNNSRKTDDGTIWLGRRDGVSAVRPRGLLYRTTTAAATELELFSRHLRARRSTPSRTDSLGPAGLFFLVFIFFSPRHPPGVHAAPLAVVAARHSNTFTCDPIVRLVVTPFTTPHNWYDVRACRCMQCTHRIHMGTLHECCRREFPSRIPVVLHVIDFRGER